MADAPFYKLTVCKKNTAARRLCQEGVEPKIHSFPAALHCFCAGFLV
ncbi:hypothetical protein FAEPRAM212_03141 [Faecalibacterium prausnitzii M21/2]|uniref:Uncharacterized protein n=1 Tax=Faecalibacterium prausnitzii M21/2 TaxID=411485 RepID=A8SGR7_9FIRM|nr:hypothetical protein FAEPRAM212_03141 [Faecalibacterium prausnitzii M21/2]